MRIYYITILKEFNTFFEKTQKMYERFCCIPTIEGALFGALFLFCLFLCNLRFLLGDHLGELSFALLAGFGVDVELLPFTVWQSWIEAAFPKVIVYLIHTSGSRLAYLSRLLRGVPFLFPKSGLVQGL